MVIVGMKEASLSLSKIGDIVGRPKSIVSRVLKRHNECKSLTPANNSSRPQKLNDQYRPRAQERS